MREKITRYKNIIVVILLGILLLFVYGYQLHHPPEPYYDEVHYVKFVRQLIYENYYNFYANTHPPLWHLLVALCIEIFGDFSFPWRIVSLSAGLGVLYLVYSLTKKITASPQIAALATFFMAFDCLSLTQARIAMNSLMLLFMLLSLSHFLDAFKKEKPFNSSSLRNAGIFFGLALSTKFISLKMLLFLIPLFILELKNRKNERSFILRDILLYFLVAPLAIFLCVYLFVPLLKDSTFTDIWKIFAFQTKYHLTTQQTHTYGSRWWSWPLMFRPIWFYYQKQPNATVSGILCIGNPAIFWLIPIIVGNLFWGFFRKKSTVSGLILLGFLTQWLSHALVRRVQFFHHFYTAMPFVAMGLGLLIIRVWRMGKVGRGIVIAYLILVAAMFVYWYPLLAGLSIPHEYYKQHMWFRSWI